MSAKKRSSNSATKTRVPLAKAQSSFASALDEIDSEEDERRRQSCTTLPRKLTFGQCESQVGRPYQTHQGWRNYCSAPCAEEVTWERISDGSSVFSGKNQNLGLEIESMEEGGMSLLQK